MKLIITGGHITPALAVISELQKNKSLDIILVGRKYQPQSEDLSFEYQSVSKLGIRFINLDAGRLSRIISFRSFINITKFLPGLVKSIQILKEEKPDKIVSFGGYIALSIAIAGWILKIPVYTHEQTIIPGLTNRLIARFAKKVFLTFPESSKYFKRNTLITGNPLRSSIFSIQKKIIEIKTNKKVLYITGGSLGSHDINLRIEEILIELTKNYFIIHQVGDVKEFNDYDRLKKQGNENYNVFKHILDDQIGYIYSKADIIVSRSGANTTLELIALNKPGVLVPLPWSANGEQLAHAQLLEKNGVAEIYDQYENSTILFNKIEKISKNYDEYKSHFASLKKYNYQEAAKTIAHEIIE